MKKSKHTDTESKSNSKSNDVNYSAQRQKKLKESSRYRPLGFLRKNLERGQVHMRTAL